MIQIAKQKAILVQLSSMPKDAPKAERAELMSQYQKQSEIVQASLKSLKAASAPT